MVANIIEQKISSAGTSISSINKIYKLLPQLGYEKETIILDYGCGKYNKNKEEAEKHGYRWFGYDPYNRSEEENNLTSKLMKLVKPHVIVCSNVCNVIQEDSALMNVLNQIYNYASEDTDIYITIYEGDKSGVGKVTTKGYQRNEKVSSYKDYICEFFDILEVKGNIIKCRKVV
jgi:hypothetical protein